MPDLADVPWQVQLQDPEMIVRENVPHKIMALRLPDLRKLLTFNGVDISPFAIKDDLVPIAIEMWDAGVLKVPPLEYRPVYVSDDYKDPGKTTAFKDMNDERLRVTAIQLGYLVGELTTRQEILTMLEKGQEPESAPVPNAAPETGQAATEAPETGQAATEAPKVIDRDDLEPTALYASPSIDDLPGEIERLKAEQSEADDGGKPSLGG